MVLARFFYISTVKLEMKMLVADTKTKLTWLLFYAESDAIEVENEYGREGVAFLKLKLQLN